MSVLDKVKETKFFLQKINENYNIFPEVQYYFNAFLNSSYSIPAHLLEDYNKKYNLGITLNDKLAIKDFKQKAKELNNSEALKFISWYQENLNKINSTTLGKIIHNKRNQATHRQSVEVEDYAKLMWGEHMPENVIEQIKLANPRMPKTVIYTEEMAYVEVKDCGDFLISMVDMVSEALQKFPNELMDVKW